MLTGESILMLKCLKPQTQTFKYKIWIRIPTRSSDFRSGWIKTVSTKADSPNTLDIPWDPTGGQK